ncbi:MAG: response regulator [Acidobacteria bacterium]|nr:response regulator [Acidobacteriota bacterium]MCI0721615.1 response regulator [Acidobacteriota bacterium]
MSKKILVIDDDPKMLVLERTILVQGGFAVETASDGVEGLEKLQAGRYDGIVLDVMMPRMDGYETAQQIKKLEAHKTTPIVMVTASTERSAMSQGFRSGAIAFLTKPFTAKKFLSMIQTIIR